MSRAGALARRVGSPATGVPVAADKRFRRPDVRPARRPRPRSTGWRAVRLTLVMLLCAGAAWAAMTLAVKARSLRIESVSVRGNVRLSRGEVEALAHGLKGESILSANLDEYRQRLLESPWVASATLRRVLPSTVEISVTERAPMAVARSGRQLFLIDADGLVIDEYTSQYAAFDLPVIDGLLTIAGSGAPVVDVPRARFAARILGEVDGAPVLRGRVSQLNVADLHDAVALLDGDRALLHLGESQFAERIQRYLEVAPTLREKLSDLDYVDLRFDERIYAMPRTVVKADK